MSVTNRRLSESYGDILSTNDVVTLFSGLMERKGGKRTPAAELCGITPASTYLWEDGVKYIKTKNKKKVLRACLDVDHEFALDLVLKSMYERTLDIGIRLLREYYELILDSTGDDYKIMLNSYLSLKNTYVGIFNTEYYEELLDMRQDILEKSKELGISISKRSLDELDNAELQYLFMNILTYCLDPSKNMADIDEHLLSDIDLPPVFLENLSKYK